MSSSIPTKPLASRDVNTSLPSPAKLKTTTSEESINKLKGMDYHRQVLQSRMAEDKSKETYISPSDSIMSPCTKKLSEYKSKHFMRAKPQFLFAKMEGYKTAGAGKSDVGSDVEGKL